MKPYNGHRSWNAWNVHLWITSDYDMYTWAVDLVNCKGHKRAAKAMYQQLKGLKTPDGAKYTKIAIYLAIQEIAE